MAKLLVIDTETGGLDAQIHSVLSLGAVVWEDGKLLDEIELFIEELPMMVTLAALRVSKIELLKMENAMSPNQAVSRLSDFLARNFGAVPPQRRIELAGHNVSFDVGFLQRLYRLAGIDRSAFEKLFSHRLMDTSMMFRFLIFAGRLADQKASLSDCLNCFQIQYDSKSRHSALQDARYTASLLSKLLEMVPSAVSLPERDASSIEGFSSPSGTVINFDSRRL